MSDTPMADRCRRTGEQWCVVCDDETCSDNVNPLALRVRAAEARAERAERLAVELADEYQGWVDREARLAKTPSPDVLGVMRRAEVQSMRVRLGGHGQ